MTHHVAHTNKMISELKDQYQSKIEYLTQKIEEQEQEIAKLKTMVSLLSQDREYDC
jgi:cell division protein FtsB